MPLALALIALAISIWIAVPGPIAPLFALTVAATELWPILTVLDAIVLTIGLRSRGSTRPASVVIASAAFLCTLIPPSAYLIGGPHVPLEALLAPLPVRANAATLRSDAPVVLTLYGGAWKYGSPQTDRQLNAIIASWGYRVIALDYPHAPRFRWPAQREAVLRQIDRLPPGRIAILGHSSGAQLAIIAAALRPRRISALITYESPVDLRLAFEHPSQPDIINQRQVLLDLCGGTPDQQPGCYRSGSPRYIVHAGMPPVLMIAAGRDHIVDVSFERLLRDELRSYGVSVTYVELPWADHAFELIPAGFHSRIALWHLHTFLVKHPW
jgi:acetyl esterase/lipase